MSGAILTQFPIHLGPGGYAGGQPEFSGDMAWYADYSARTAADGANGWLVSQFTFTESWTSWECHPAGHEVVVCTAGTITLIQELVDGTEERVTLTPGQYAINPPGVWHTADVDGSATALFITCGQGTQGRAR